MTIYLLAMRQGLVMYTAMMVWPFETVFDVIDDELERRGVVPEEMLKRKLQSVPPWTWPRFGGAIFATKELPALEE